MGPCQSKPETKHPTEQPQQKQSQQEMPKATASTPNTQNKPQQQASGTGQDLFDTVSEKQGKITREYNLVSPPLGKGAYGEVRKAIHKSSGQVRAVKILSKQHTSQVEQERLRNEVEILKRLDHPNIIKVYEFYQDDKFFYIVTELCMGGELFDKIQEEKSFSEKKAAFIMKQILQAIYYCHQHKIVHRDLKPENLLLESDKDDSQLKVIDFGTSRNFDPTHKLSQRLGTPYYIAPEVLKRKYDEKCDIWSCGVILYILLCGYPPFSGKNDEKILEKVSKGEYDFDSEEWDQISDEAKMFIRKLMEYEPSKRYSAQQALNDPWMKKYADRSDVEAPVIEKVLSNMKTFRSNMKLQEATFMYIVNQLTTKDEKAELMKTFQSLDKNGDGVLSKAELMEGYKKTMNEAEAEDEVNKIMAQVDKNNSGEIDYSEFVAASINRQNVLSQQRLDTAFKTIDKDGSGSLTVDELKQIFGGGKIPDDVWKQIIDEVHFELKLKDFLGGVQGDDAQVGSLIERQITQIIKKNKYLDFQHQKILFVQRSFLPVDDTCEQIENTHHQQGPQQTNWCSLEQNFKGPQLNRSCSPLFSYATGLKAEIFGVGSDPLTPQEQWEWNKRHHNFRNKQNYFFYGIFFNIFNLKMLKQPVGIIQMTNVAIIRYRMNDKHFEIACYKNKAINYRNGVEKDLREVLQIDKIFTSASHGDVASKKDLKYYFGDMKEDDIIKRILEKGELQLGEKERDAQIHQIYLGIVKFIQEKCVHPVSRRPFNQQSIEHALSKIKYIVKPDQPTKKQALLAIKLLQEQFHLQRAKMKVKINILAQDKDELNKQFEQLEIEKDEIISENSNSVELIIDPSKFRPLSQILKDSFKNSAIEVVDANLSNREVEDIENADTVELEPRQEKNQVKKEQKQTDEEEPVKAKKQDKKEKQEKQEKPKNSKKKNGKQQQEEQKIEAPVVTQIQAQAQPVNTASDKQFKCSMCTGAGFDTNAEFRQHYKSDWHNYNLKLKNKGLPTLSNEDYLEVLLAEQIDF